MATYQTVGEFTSGERLTSADMEALRENVDLVNAQSQAFARNLLYNGAMQVAQRSGSVASITTTGYYTADRWQTGLTTLGTWTQSVQNDAPAESGLRKSVKMLCTTADASPAAADRAFVNQALEGFDVQRLAKGTASAQSLTLSFWVKSNKTGTYIAGLYDNDNTRHCAKAYTISAVDTWERKEVVFPADTAGVFDNDNAASLVATFYLGVGSNYSSGTLATSWAAYTAANDAPGQTNVAAATNNYWQMTGAQLEVGTVSTPFAFLPFGDELRRCQRYYEKSYEPTTAPGTFTNAGAPVVAGSSNGSSLFYVPITFAVTKRATPGTILFWNEGGVSNAWDFQRSGLTSGFIPTTGYQGSHGFSLYGNIGAAWVVATTWGHWTASAEL